MSELAAAVRFVHLASAILLAGSFAFVALIARPAGHPQLELHRRIAAWSLLALVVSAVVMLWLQALNVAGVGASGARIVPSLVAATLYGKVWAARMVLAAALAALLWLPLRERGNAGRADAGPSFWTGLALSAGLLASLALSGHAAAGEGAELAVHMTSDAVHLLAAGAWLGGLVPLFVLLKRAGPGVAAEATRRYSLLGVTCVTALIVTGLYNAGVLVGDPAQLFGTPYGRLLLLKIALILPLLAVAALNLLRLNPGIVSTSGEAPRLVARLRRNVAIEVALGLAILAIVGSLGVTPPARHVPPDWPFAFRWDWTLLDKGVKARADFQEGLMWCSAGLTAMVLAFFLSRVVRWLLAAGGAAMLVYSGTLVLGAATTDAYPTTYRRPAVAYQAISVANGRILYAKNCVTCHGVEGRGDGPAAEGMRPKPADLTARHANDHTAGDLYWWLSHGVKGSAMPGFASVLSEEERWDLINFSRALSAGERARSLATVIEDRPWLVAPDFAYAAGRGPIRLLKDHRGSRLVLLVLAGGRESQARLDQLAAEAARLDAAGVDLIAVPRDPRRVARPQHVTEGNDEIHETYSLFARGFSEEAPAHVEFLIDRQGYVRARWLPAESAGWSKLEALYGQVELLRKEKPRALVPDDHVH
jgi:putative copper export protein/mono/diheme cytochrome c family protein